MKKQVVHYKPYTERLPDDQYEKLIRSILENGKQKTSFHAQANENKESGHKFCLETPGKMLQYYIPNGVPITPVRDLSASYRGAIGEMIGFINGARTLKELMFYGCPKIFWDRWVTKEKCDIWGLEEGDLGPGSYGPMFTALPMFDGRTFNQVSALERQMKRNPFARTNLISSWYTPLAMGDKAQGSPRNVVVAPCHGNIIQFDVMNDRTMHMTVYQRSSDVPVGLVLNLTEWVAFGMMVAYIADLKFEWYTHFLPNPQIYDIQFDALREILQREARPLPSLYLQPEREIVSLTDFRKTDFILEDYNPHPKMFIPSVV